MVWRRTMFARASSLLPRRSCPHKGFSLMASIDLARLGRLGIALCCMAIVAGCYGNHPHQPDPKTFHSSRSTASVSIVEANDRGNFWYANQAISAIDTVLDRARKGNTVVVLFVHGWGHAART